MIRSAGAAACILFVMWHTSSLVACTYTRPCSPPVRLSCASRLPCSVHPACHAGDIAAAVDAEFAAHMAAVEGQTDAIIAGCFSLLPRLAEIESMVGVQRLPLPCRGISVTDLWGQHVQSAGVPCMFACCIRLSVPAPPATVCAAQLMRMSCA